MLKQIAVARQQNGHRAAQHLPHGADRTDAVGGMGVLLRGAVERERLVDPGGGAALAAE